MNIADAISDLDRQIEEGRARWVRERNRRMAADPTRPAWEVNKEAGEAMAVDLAPIYSRREKLRLPIVSLTSHQGRLLLATSGGVFELKDDKLVEIELQVDLAA